MSTKQTIKSKEEILEKHLECNPMKPIQHSILNKVYAAMEEYHSQFKTDFQIAWEMLDTRDKPFFLNEIRSLINLLLKEEITMSKFVEELNTCAYKWRSQFRPIDDGDVEKWIEDWKRYSEMELTELDEQKQIGNLRPGAKVKIEWQNLDGTELCIDYGYAFLTPFQDDGIDDYFIHVPSPDNSSGKGNVPPEWQHINQLLSNRLVKKIIIEPDQLLQSSHQKELDELAEILKVYIAAIDNIYNHNEDTRAAVIRYFGLHHPPIPEWFRKYIPVETQLKQQSPEIKNQ